MKFVFVIQAQIAYSNYAIFRELKVSDALIAYPFLLSNPNHMLEIQKLSQEGTTTEYKIRRTGEIRRG